MFGNGGVTSPDIWIVISIIIIALISIVLNPLVFKHNFFKKNSLARDLYMALSATDFLTCTVLPVSYSVGILRPIEQQCFTDHNVTYCLTDYIHYSRPATLTEKLVTSLILYLIFSPMCITSALCISRWYKISYPLKFLSRIRVEMSLLVLCILLALYFPLMLLSDIEGKPTIMMISTQMAWNDNPFGVDRPPIQVEEILAISLTVVSTVTSVLAVWKILLTPSVPGNPERRTKKVRSTVRITLMNLGNVAYVGVLLSLVTAKSFSRGHVYLQTVMCALPILLSAYNPVVYALLTNGVFSRNRSI